MEQAMLSPDRVPTNIIAAPCADDYGVVRRAIAFISEHWRSQPEIEAIAHAAGVTPDELHHLFRRWAGLTPKAFLQALTIDRARTLLRDSASVLDAPSRSACPGRGGCTTCSSPTRRCRRANGRRAARASSCATASTPRRSASLW